MAETKTLLTETKTLAYLLPDQSALAAEGAAAKATASILVIDDQKSLEIATQEMTALAKRRKELEAARKAITGPLDQAKKSTMALFKPVIQDIDDAITAIKDGIARYTVEQERLAAIERAKAEAEAAAERKALEEAAEAAGSDEERAVLQEAASTVMAVATVAKPKAAGMSTRKAWQAEVVDLSAFLKHVAEHPELQQCVEVKEGALTRIVSATGGTIQIPGVKVSQKVIVAARTA